MKQARWMLMVLAALLLSIGIASAELNYILPDSNSRELTWDEVARWDYEYTGKLIAERKFEQLEMYTMNLLMGIDK